MRRLASSVLIFEAILAMLALPVAVQISNVAAHTAVIGAGVFFVSAIVITALLRHRAAYVAGSVLQALVIASGAVVPGMYFLGVIFAALWIAALWLGSRTYASRPG